MGGAAGGGRREAGNGKREAEQQKRRAAKAGGVARAEPNEPGVPAPRSLFPVSDLPSTSRLTLYLLPTPRAIETRTEERRDHILPIGYRDGGAWYGILSAAGPDRVSGERWGDAYAREYFRCIVDDGGMVWLYRDARADGWYIHGWWD